MADGTFDQGELIPRNVLDALYKGLVYGHAAISDEDRHAAWEWLEEHDRYEWFG